MIKPVSPFLHVLLGVLFGASDVIAEEREPVGTFYGHVLNYDCTVPEIDDLGVVAHWRRSKSLTSALMSLWAMSPSWVAVSASASAEADRVFSISWDDDMYKEVSFTVEVDGFRGIKLDNYGSRQFGGDDYRALLEQNRPDNPAVFYYDADYARETIRRHTEATTTKFLLHGYNPGFNPNGPAKVGEWKDYGSINDYHIELGRNVEEMPVLKFVAPRGGFILTEESGLRDISLPVDGYRPVLEVALSEKHRDVPPRRLNFLTRTMRGRAYGYMSLTYQVVSIEQQLARNPAAVTDGRRLDDYVEVLVYHDRIISEDELRIGVYAGIEKPVLKARQCGGFMPLSPDGPLNEYKGVELVEAAEINEPDRRKAAEIRAQRQKELEAQDVIASLEEEIRFGFPAADRLDAVAKQYGSLIDVRLLLLEQPQLRSETIEYLYSMYGRYELETYRFAQNENTPAYILLELCNTTDTQVVEYAIRSLAAAGGRDMQKNCKVIADRAMEEWQARH